MTGAEIPVKVEIPSSRVGIGTTRVHVRASAGVYLGGVQWEPSLARVRVGGEVRRLPREYLTPAADAAGYVVTFDARRIACPGQIFGLTRMTLDAARALVTEAARIPKTGRVINAVTLEEVTAS